MRLGSLPSRVDGDTHLCLRPRSPCLELKFSVHVRPLVSMDCMHYFLLFVVGNKSHLKEGKAREVAWNVAVQRYKVRCTETWKLTTAAAIGLGALPAKMQPQ